MENQQLLQRIEKLEKKLAQYERFMTITPTRVILKQSILVNGTLNADRVYTKRSGNHIELIT
jgi:cell division septum initiation protein DivIVA